MVESFGERVLRKMGWQQGKGLGSQGQGLARPIALETQNSTKGVGYDSEMFEPWWDKLYDQTAQRIGQRSSKISGTAQGFNNCEKRADFYEEIKNSKSVRSIEGKIKVSKSLVNDRFNSVSNLPCAIEMMEISEDNIQSDSEVVKDTSFSTKKILKRPGRRNFTRDVDVLVPRRKKTKKMQSSRLV